MPNQSILGQIEEMQEPPKRKPGRPKGSKDKAPRQHLDVVDPKTGVMIRMDGANTALEVGRIGDEKVSQFVAYHIEMMKMRQGVNKKDVSDLYRRFAQYLAYCAEHGILPNNMNAYYAIGVIKQEMSAWRLGQAGTPEHKKFAEEVSAFFASVHEQSATSGLINPVYAMFQQKTHDGFVEASKLEVANVDPLGEKKSAAEIAEKYEDVILPD